MIDLNPTHLETVRQILAEHVPGCEVRAFGSRATWTAKDYSDLDLAIVGDAALDWSTLGRLREAFEESDLPIQVDVLDWHGISQSFRQVIGRDCEIVQKQATGSTVARNDWRPVSFGKCALLIRDNVSVPEAEDVPYIGLEHIGKETLSLVGYGEASSVTSTKTRFQRGDILFGKLRPYFRKVVRVPFDGICSTDIWVVRATEGVDQGFLHYCMASWPFVDFATAGAEGTRMPRAKWEHVSRYEISLPPLPEQRAIAHILGTLDDKIELNRRMNETLEGMARALFKSWFVDFEPVRAKMEGRWRRGASLPGMPAELYDLFPDGLVDSELGEIPAGWSLALLPELIEVNPQRPLQKGTVAPYLDMANMPTRGHVPDSVLERPFRSGMRFANGDTLIARITPCLENGKTAYVDFLRENEIGWGSTEYIVMKPRPPLPHEFAYFLARSTRFREFAIRNMSGTSGRQRVPVSALSSFSLLSPPAQLTAEFGCTARTLLSQASQAVQESRTLAALRDTLLPKLISGDVRAWDRSTSHASRCMMRL